MTDGKSSNPPRAENGGEKRPIDVKASSSVPAQAERQEKKVHGVAWGLSFDEARELAAAEMRPILIDFTGVNCINCRRDGKPRSRPAGGREAPQEIRDRATLH